MKSGKDSHNQSSVRINNRRLVLDFIRSANFVTISQITAHIKLSKTTIWKIIDHLIQKNLVLEAGKAEVPDDVGKKPELFRFNEKYGFVISIAIFATSIYMTLTDARVNIFYKEIVHLQGNEPIDFVIEIISEFIAKKQETSSHSYLLGIVIGSTGVVDTKEGICYTAPKFTSWGGSIPIKKFIEDKITLLAPFYIDNSNRFYAFAEKSLGCAKDHRNIVDIVAGFDGVGAGIIAEDTLKRGPNFLTGEIGHLRLDPYEKTHCSCGGTGCFEQLISLQKLVNKAESYRKEFPESQIFTDSSKSITPKIIFQASNNGDPLA
ncbi:MAG: ROK family transcriptional regulator, partial [Peptostreptococcaceae bacterium]|nr:ROK family transcriptional regulator [Peptostreptococcaceae bacterium]